MKPFQRRSRESLAGRQAGGNPVLKLFFKDRFKTWIPAFAGMTVLIAHAAPSYATPSIENGKAVFIAQCARCHGADAKGEGPDAKRMTVAPRDLTSGKFKFKSTAWGTPPSDEDLIKGVIGHGLAGSGMPSFANLSPEVRADIVAYIKSISPAFQTGVAPQPIPDPANRRAKADLVKGKEVFEKMQCGSCHGPNGHANGTSAFTLKDAWERPIKVANLTQGWTYRGGSAPIDIYHRIVAGIEGAPMPSYEGAASHEDIWQLCNYVASLQLKTNWSGEIVAPVLNAELPTKADDEVWEKAKRTDVNLQGYVYQSGRRAALTVNAVSVQAIANDKAIAFRIFWDDPIQNSSGLADALLVALKPSDYSGDPRGNLHTLYENDSPPLDIMTWLGSNPVSVAQKKATLVSALRSPASGNSLASSAVYSDGRWTLVFTRPLDMQGGELKKGETRDIAFAAWDGHNGESGLKHASSQWIRLALGDSKEH